jgi:hypothetical protein
MNAKRNLYTIAVMIIYSLRFRALWDQWKTCMELRERKQKRE